MAGPGSPLRARLPPVALVALALIVGSGLYAVLDLFFPPALSLALVCLPILPWLRPGFLRSPRTAVDAQESVEVLPHFPVTVQTGGDVGGLGISRARGGPLDSRSTSCGGQRLQAQYCRRCGGAGHRLVRRWDGNRGTSISLGRRPELRGFCPGLQRGTDAGLPPGTPVRAVGAWQRKAHPVAAAPGLAGTLLLSDVRPDESDTTLRFAGARARLRGRIESRMRDLLPATHGPWPAL